MCAVTHFYNVQYFYVFSKSKVLIIIIINMVNIIVTYDKAVSGHQCGH